MGVSLFIRIAFNREVELHMIKEVIEIINSFDIFYYKYDKETEDAYSQKDVASWFYHDLDNPKLNEVMIDIDPSLAIKGLSDKGGHILMQSNDDEIYFELWYDKKHKKDITFYVPNSSVNRDENKVNKLKQIAQTIKEKLNGESIEESWI